jgi:hypothetical protein
MLPLAISGEHWSLLLEPQRSVKLEGGKGGRWREGGVEPGSSSFYLTCREGERQEGSRKREREWKGKPRSMKTALMTEATADRRSCTCRRGTEIKEEREGSDSKIASKNNSSSLLSARDTRAA